MRVCDVCRKKSVATLILTANDGEQGFDLCPTHYQGLMTFLTEKSTYEIVEEKVKAPGFDVTNSDPLLAQTLLRRKRKREEKEKSS